MWNLKRVSYVWNHEKTLQRHLCSGELIKLSGRGRKKREPACRKSYVIKWRGIQGHFPPVCPMEGHLKGHFITCCPLEGHLRALYHVFSQWKGTQEVILLHFVHWMGIQGHFITFFSTSGRDSIEGTLTCFFSQWKGTLEVILSHFVHWRVIQGHFPPVCPLKVHPK